MKVLLLKDVYKLGHAGDVKKVADGYARNYLILRGLATLATAGSLAHAEKVRDAATKLREKMNTEMSAVAEKLGALTLHFTAKAGETGKLYGSITTQMITEAIQRESDVDVDRRNIGHQPLRELGTYKVQVRLTADITPSIKVIVHREGSEAEGGEAKPAEAAPVQESPQA